MSVTEGKIQVTPTDKYLDTSVVTQSDGEKAHRENVCISDPEVLAARANVGKDILGNYNLGVRFAHDGHVDAFARLRVSDPVGLFDSQFQYDKQPLLWNETTANNGTATHLPNESAIRMRAATDSGSHVILQTRAYHRYQPGKSQLIFATFNYEEAVENNRKCIGYFDDNNGVFLEQNGTVCSVVLRSSTSGSVVETRVVQASWNIDPLDGTGPSGITIDLTKTQILVIDLQWLGVGAVRFGFDVDGVPYYAHAFNNANALTVPYMTTANLPVRYEIINDAAIGAATDLKAICASVISEGGFSDALAFPFSADNGVAGTTVGTTEIPIISGRPAATFNSITNQSIFLMRSVELAAAVRNIKYRLLLNATLTGASFAAPNGFSAGEIDTSATSFTGGVEVDAVTLLAGGQVRGGASLGDLGRIPFGFDIDGTNPDVLTVVAEASAAGGSAYVTLRWKEIR